MKKGIVYLVGAGPWDPELITIKGRRLIGEADVIIYDYLANPELLSFARDDAEIIYAGKKGGCHSLSQDEINKLIVNKALEGKKVVRLKGGDPFLFGRGGEEAEMLAKMGISFEVVPGVSSAIAVPAYAGIPLTHRDFASTVLIVTGHEGENKHGSGINWDKIAAAEGTIVFLMGVKNLPIIVSNLIKGGKIKETPVAVIQWGTRGDQRVVTGKLSDIIEKVEKAGIGPPAVTVVGEVVSLRDLLNWFETKPLFGKGIVVTRARAQASALSSLLSESGAFVYEFPTIETVPIRDYDKIDSAISRLNSYDWIIFTSVNGVKFFLKRMFQKGFDIRDLKGLKVCAIGPATRHALEEMHIRVDVIPSEYRAEAVVEAMKNQGIEGMRILLPRAKVARDVIPEELSKNGAVVDVVEVYETVMPEGKKSDLLRAFQEGRIHMITFTSSSTVENFHSMFSSDEIQPWKEKVPVACIGPITAKKADEMGFRVEVVAEKFTIPSLVDAIERYFTNKED